jgi:hypothetical protein
MATSVVEYASLVGPLLHQVAGAVASFTRDSAYGNDRVYRVVLDHNPETRSSCYRVLDGAA